MAVIYSTKIAKEENILVEVNKAIHVRVSGQGPFSMQRIMSKGGIHK